MPHHGAVGKGVMLKVIASKVRIEVTLGTTLGVICGIAEGVGLEVCVGTGVAVSSDCASIVPCTLAITVAAISDVLEGSEHAASKVTPSGINSHVSNCLHGFISQASTESSRWKEPS